MPPVAAQTQVESGSTGPLIELTIKRVASGVQIKAKSSVFEKFFSEIHDGIGGGSKQTSQHWPGQGYRISDSMVVPSGIMVNNWGGRALRPGVNLSFLRAAGLKDGYEFTMSGAHSREAIESWVNEARDQIKRLYLECIKPVEYRLSITVEELR